ncbi:hypothetical protein HMPREF1604_04953 [Escherichia coli 908519]|nr:hypothetical protein HMPREF9553_01396 [Escherichia coli MS 200-1]ESD34147.1 hypothetical protein HMPREF1604_04953 [Escherichia coli 908519]
MSHPAIGARCLMRRWRVLSGLHWCRIGRPDKAFTPYPAYSARCDAAASYRAYKSSEP